jgi:hypothetical protein
MIRFYARYFRYAFTMVATLGFGVRDLGPN